MALLEPIYHGYAAADYFHRETAWAVRQYVEARIPYLRAGESIEILEAGGGTGATTAFVLEALASYADRVRYTFTDVSKAFLKRATGLPVTPRLLDVEKDAREQGYAAGAYDVVICANVLHATRSIRHTLRNIKPLLRRGGRLVLNEATEVQDILTLTFGLLDGWWAFADPEYRLPGSPLLSESTWKRLLVEEGFPKVVVSSDERPEENRLGQRILVAESDGVASERRTSNRNSADAEMAIVLAVADVLELKIEDVPRDVPFADYGMDSILGIEMIDRVRTALGVELPSTAIFDYPSVRKLAERIAGIVEQPAAILRQVPAAADAIAIIGLSGRFPGAKNAQQFWRNLAAGRCSITEVPADRWSWRTAKTPSKWGGFLDDVAGFDPLFFNMSGSEARVMDPQQRLFLMECWRALEDAGYTPEMLHGRRCGVFAGANDGDYRRLLETSGTAPSPHWLPGNDSSILAARIAYFLDLKGPTLSINAACASSLVAIHLACRAILAGDADLMLAGGVYIGVTPGFHIQAGNMGMLSPTGVCHAFDSRANGFVPGEGVGAVVLKRLSEAVRDGDPIYGVIRGSATNQDGKTNGITAPSARSQCEVELAVIARAARVPNLCSMWKRMARARLWAIRWKFRR